MANIQDQTKNLMFEREDVPSRQRKANARGGEWRLAEYKTIDMVRVFKEDDGTETVSVHPMPIGRGFQTNDNRGEKGYKSENDDRLTWHTLEEWETAKKEASLRKEAEDALIAQKAEAAKLKAEIAAEKEELARLKAESTVSEVSTDKPKRGRPAGVSNVSE